MYIPKKAFKDINDRLEHGDTYLDSIKYTAYFYGFEPSELRTAYEKRAYRSELLSNTATALGMLAIFLCPVIFYFVARG